MTAWPLGMLDMLRGFFASWLEFELFLDLELFEWWEFFFADLKESLLDEKLEFTLFVFFLDSLWCYGDIGFLPLVLALDKSM